MPALLPTTLAEVIVVYVVWRTISPHCGNVMHVLVGIGTWAILKVNRRLGEFLPWTRQARHVLAWLPVVRVFPQFAYFVGKQDASLRGDVSRLRTRPRRAVSHSVLALHPSLRLHGKAQGSRGEF